MDRSVKRDLRFVQKACEKILRRFPNAPIRLYWWDMSESFVITTNNRELYDSEEYTQLIYELYDDMFRHARNRVDFIGFSLNDDNDNNTSEDPTCIEFEIKYMAKNKKRDLVYSH